MVGTLLDMSFHRTANLTITTALVACLMGLPALSAVAAPASPRTAADSVTVERAVAQYDAARDRAAQIDTRMAQTAASLDKAVAEENEARDLLRSRIRAMYRTGDMGFITVLLSAATVQDFVTRWDLLSRIAGQDADTLRQLKDARVRTERSAEQLIALQGDQARALEAMEDEVARARQKLASSQAALKSYEAKTAAPAKAKAPVSSKADPTQKLTGSGAWKTAVASHYGRNFTGRGASGERIGPYSMIVAHKTLPFGTLVEFEYNGKRAVAKVADRGPYTAGRTFDLGPGVIRVLGFSGVHEVRYRVIGR